MTKGDARLDLATVAPKRLALWCAALALVAIGIGATAIYEVNATAVAKDRVIAHQAQALLDVEQLRIASERDARKIRAYLLTSDPTLVPTMLEARQAFDASMAELTTIVHEPIASALIEDVKRDEAARRQAVDHVIDMARTSTRADVDAYFEGTLQPRAANVDGDLDRLYHARVRQLEIARARSADLATQAIRALVAASAAATSLAVLFGLLLLRAIARLRASKQELERHVERVESANRDLDAFAGRVAHDLRGALAPLPLATGMLRRGASKADTIEKAAARLDRVGERALRLIEGLLSFSRAGRPADEEATCDVVKAIDESLEEVASAIAGDAIDLHIDVKASSIRCSPSLFHVVMTNLLGNAIKFLHGRPERRIEIHAHETTEHCVIRVSDSGPGIPKDAIERIFEPFFRVAGASAVPGSGIGLATVDRVVRAHGGRVEVESKVGEGTSFVLTFPRAAEASRAAPSDSGIIDAQLAKTEATLATK